MQNYNLSHYVIKTYLPTGKKKKIRNYSLKIPWNLKILATQSEHLKIPIQSFKCPFFPFIWQMNTFPTKNTPF